jgi:biopolymer transport protein ExbB
MRRGILGGAVGTAVGATVLAAGAAFAQDAAAADGLARPEGRPFIELILAGGYIGFVIILCSIAGMAIAIENAVTLKREKLCPPRLVSELEALLDAGRYDEAAALCGEARCSITNVVGAAAERAAEGYDAMVDGMQAALDRENVRAMQRISTLSLLGGIGPMLGLTGTVLGMIRSFTVIESVPTPSPALLAKGIYEALVTTAMGLFLAIPVLAVYFVLRNRLQILAMDLNETAGRLVERFKPAAE